MNSIAELLNRYLALYPEEKESFVLLRRQIVANEDVVSRRNFTGHVTGSGLVLSPDRSHVLLIHHRFLERWLQPGGHMEPHEITPYDTALREVREETGLQPLRYIGRKE